MKKFTGCIDDNGFPIYVNDILVSEYEYCVSVKEKDGDFYGKLLCDKSHSCHDVPYDLNGGEGYTLIYKDYKNEGRTTKN